MVRDFAVPKAGEQAALSRAGIDPDTVVVLLTDEDSIWVQHIKTGDHITVRFHRALREDAAVPKEREQEALRRVGIDANTVAVLLSHGDGIRVQHRKSGDIITVYFNHSKMKRQ